MIFFSCLGSTCSIQLLEVNDETKEFNSRMGRPVRQIEERLHLIERKQK